MVVPTIDLEAFELSAESMAASKVMVVDDDETITSSISTLLKTHLELEPTVFNCGREALAYVDEAPLDLVISDLRMPEVDGIQLLGALRTAQPLTTRILLSGYADKASALAAINDIQVFQFVQKPWDSEILARTVRNGLERRHLLRVVSETIEKLADTESDLARIRKGLMRAFA